MPAGITNFDQMFSVREKPWHGLGVILPEIATAKEAIEAANLGWKVEKQPCYRKNAAGEFEEIAGRYCNVRTDIDIALGGGLGEQYIPLQNTDAFKFMDAVCQDPGAPKYVTAGSLWEGRRVWMLVKMPSFVEITKTDIVEEFLLLANSHDGTRSVEVLWTPIRVVCQNTLNLALADDRPGRVTMRHTSNLMTRINEVADLLGVCQQSHETFAEITQAMRAYKPKAAEVDTVCQALFMKSCIKESAAYKAAHEGVNQFFREGEANKAAGDTKSAWALYNGITEYVDYKRPIRTDTPSARLDRAWFGTGSALKAQAMIEVSALVR